MAWYVDGDKSDDTYTHLHDSSDDPTTWYENYSYVHDGKVFWLGDCGGGNGYDIASGERIVLNAAVTGQGWINDYQATGQCRTHCQ